MDVELAGGQDTDAPRQSAFDRARAFYDTRPGFTLTVAWVPGHMDVSGNELADALAKEAALGREHRPARVPGHRSRELPRAPAQRLRKQDRLRQAPGTRMGPALDAFSASDSQNTTASLRPLGT